MTLSFKLIALSTAIAVGGISMAEAKNKSHRGQPVSFETLDADGNGEITKQEMEARGAARFADADTNGDGALSKEELMARSARASERRVSKMLERLDADDSGTLSAEELAAAPRRGGGGNKMFERADADNSGSISKEEFDTAMARRGGKRKSE